MVLAAPSPAIAASTCLPAVLDWSNVPNGPFTSTTVAGVTVTMAITATSGTLTSSNGQVQASAPSGGTMGFLKFSFQDSISGPSGVTETVTLSFSQPLANVKFTILDVDYLVGGWNDYVRINTPGYTTTIPSGSTVVGTGTNADPYRNPVNTNVQPTSASGNVTTSWAGPLSSVSFTYYQGPDGILNGVPLIGIGDITFTPTRC